MSDLKESLDDQSCVASSRMTDGLEACHKIIENYREMLGKPGDETDPSDPGQAPHPS